MPLYPPLRFSVSAFIPFLAPCASSRLSRFPSLRFQLSALRSHPSLSLPSYPPRATRRDLTGVSLSPAASTGAGSGACRAGSILATAAITDVPMATAATAVTAPWMIQR